MEPKWRLALTSLVAILFVIILWSLTEGAEAADREIYGDWTLPAGTTHIIGETIDVRGSVMVPSGAILKLENCDLAINGTSNGQRGLEVASGGRLEAYSTKIYGIASRIFIRVHDNTLLSGCEVRHFHGSSSSGGIVMDGGTISIKDTLVTDGNWHGLYVQTTATLENVTVSQVVYSNVYASTYNAPGDIDLVVTDSHMIGTGDDSQYIGGVYVSVWGSGSTVTVEVTDTLFENLRRGIYTSGNDQATVTAVGNTFVDCINGIVLGWNTDGGSYTYRNNHVSTPTLTDSTGIEVGMRDSITMTLSGNVVEDVGTGYVIHGPWSGSHTATLNDLQVTDCTRGLSADRSIRLTITNSTFTNISDSYGTFVATDGAQITVRDTLHTKGSGSASGSGSWVRAYTKVDILGAKWKGGVAIVKGLLILENATQVQVASFDLADLRPLDIVGWEVDANTRRTSTYLWPAMYIDGHAFRGDRLDIWDKTPRRVELVDDFVPTITMVTPEEGQGFAVSTIVASGTYDELGSGIDVLQYELDEMEWEDLTSYSSGNWTLPLTSVSDGVHDLYVRALDRAGNAGDAVGVRFLVDSTVPFISLIDYPELVNVTSLELSGATEAHATMSVNGRVVTVAEDGTFSTTVNLKEGANSFLLDVTDRAGNSNSTTISITSDTIPPKLVVSSPEDDTWTRARTTLVEGLSDDEAVLTVNGITVPVVNGSFRRQLELTTGNFRIAVVARDSADNLAMFNILLKVDWTPPGLIIVEPEEPTVYVRENVFYISGDLDDPLVTQVVINGVAMELTSGRFVKQFTLLEGTNEFTIVATDPAGNMNTTKVVAIRDLTPPTYTSELVALGGDLVYKGRDLYCTAPAVELHIVLDEVAYITVEGQGKLAPTKDANVHFDLSEGVNSLDLVILDAAGNQAQSYHQSIIVDTLAPSLTIIEPQPGTRTKEDVFTVRGRTEEGAKVTIEGTSIPIGSGGAFQFTVALEEGKNTFGITVEDAMGNANSTSVSVLRETEVSEQEQSSTGVAIGGFLAGLVVGFVLAVVLVTMRARRGPEAEVGPLGPGDAAKAPTRPATPAAPGETERTGEGATGEGGWEEY